MARRGESCHHDILERVGKVAYRLALPPKMSEVHNVFHISMLRKYANNPEHEINFNDIEVNNNATFNKGPVRILDHGVTNLRNKEISLVKVQWKHHDKARHLVNWKHKCGRSFHFCLVLLSSDFGDEILKCMVEDEAPVIFVR